MKWGYIVGSGGLPPHPLNLDIKSHCHALITGSSGSSKSYALLTVLGYLLQDNPRIKVTFCDFKNSEDFRFLNGYKHYYSGNDCYEGIMNYYETFCKARIEGHNSTRYLLVVDEYPAFINYLTMQDKRDKTKKANDILAVISEILMLGRGINFGVWLVTQRPDSTMFANGSRENFMVVLGLGRISKEMKGMIFVGEELPDKVYKQGEGCLLADGHPLYEIAFPKLQNVIDWKRHIKAILMKYSNL